MENRISFHTILLTTPQHIRSGNTSDNEESEYEKRRTEQIQRNIEYAHTLGILDKEEKKSKGKRGRPFKKKDNNESTRKSRRLSGLTLEEDIEATRHSHTPRKQSAVMNGRVYDSVHGVTCHQCRQKTIDEKSTCSLNPTHNFCEKCLRNRYGEEMSEVKNNPNWVRTHEMAPCDLTVLGLSPLQKSLQLFHMP